MLGHTVRPIHYDKIKSTDSMYERVFNEKSSNVPVTKRLDYSLGSQRMTFEETTSTPGLIVRVYQDKGRYGWRTDKESTKDIRDGFEGTVRKRNHLGP